MRRAVQDIDPAASAEIAMDAELEQLVTFMRERFSPPGTHPTAAPLPDESRDRWLARVAVARSHHDAAAVRAARLHDEFVVLHNGGRAAEPLPTVDSSDVLIDSGDTVVGGRLYRPAERSGAAGGALLLLHGGAFWMGGGAAGYVLNDRYCTLACVTASLVVLNLDYRLAPEHPYPASLEDAEAAVEWLHGHAGELNIDPGRMAVQGISSGGNVAAALSARLAGGPLALSGQLLQAPALNLDLSSTAFASGSVPGVDDEMVTAAGALVELYAAGADPRDPGISPGLAADLSGLPQTTIVVATFDALRADAQVYARRLVEAGVRCRVLEYPTTHTDGRPQDFARMEADMLDTLPGLTTSVARTVGDD